MLINKKNYSDILNLLKGGNATLVAVSKIRPAAVIKELYDIGQRDFGENYVQELIEKHEKLPGDIRWHFIGHLQTNKVKYIAPFVHLIHGIDSFKLLKEVNKQAEKNSRTIDVLLQVHIAGEETKFGFDENELHELLNNGANEIEQLKSIRIRGLMGMASFSENENLIRKEFQSLKDIFSKYKETIIHNMHFEILSMGMSGDYKIAIEEGSTMVRIGSLLFGSR